MAAKPVTEIIVIGGGASGVLLARHLLKDPAASVRVTLFEKRADVGLGIAYGTANPNHLLNVRVSNMSAYPEDPDHFRRWLVSTGAADRIPCPDRFCFIPRPVYGRYISGLLEAHMLERQGRLWIVKGECEAYRETPSGVEISLANGSRYEADIAVLAIGNELPLASNSDPYAESWSAACEQGLRPDDEVLTLGTGLTMIDHVLTLVHGGHRGRILAISRRGLLPHAHRHVESWPIARNQSPFSKDLATLLDWMREMVRVCEQGGGDWRSAEIRAQCATLAFAIIDGAARQSAA